MIHVSFALTSDAEKTIDFLEAARVMGYRFERPSNRGLVIRSPTPAEREARDTHIEALRKERGGVEQIAAAQAHSAACFAAAERKAATRLRRGGGRRTVRRGRR